jgi:polyphosphate kinase 2 (PPK2 family)
VLVERVEGFATEDEWGRAYDEIVQFERSLAGEGMVLVKFWLHISEQEQLNRFEHRAEDPLRAWKLTADDWRNRERRPAYQEAIDEMLARTDHEDAPWRLIEAESKRYARVRVLEEVIGAIESSTAS